MCYILALSVKLELGLLTQIICIYLQIMLDSYSILVLYLGILEEMVVRYERNYSTEEAGVKGVEED